MPLVALVEVKTHGITKYKLMVSQCIHIEFNVFTLNTSQPGLLGRQKHFLLACHAAYWLNIAHARLLSSQKGVSSLIFTYVENPKGPDNFNGMAFGSKVSCDKPIPLGDEFDLSTSKTIQQNEKGDTIDNDGMHGTLIILNYSY
ncbi:hypothetical protein OUZ56_033362 [Daphnia magna]|uniref:Uncharacterized protein n=1 Tax=Daphnia magna TaxID=35525 RepID=A0ABQ9ZXN8_9CRUS|nr:hypothetical protein OUZ56_033362 [Daphnia magna]